MRSRLAALSALLLGLLTVALVPTPARALSCAAMAPHAHVDFVRGAPLVENADGPSTLFDVYDHVVAGRVTAIRTTTASGDGGQDQLSVDLEVLAVVNRSTTTATVTVTMADRGEMSGYPFQVGQAYFVVVDDDGHLGVCGPTAPLDTVDPDPSRAVALLQAAAREGGVPVAVPASAATTVAPAAAPGSQGPPPAPPRRGPVALVAGSVLGAAGLAAVTLVLRRRRATPTDATRDVSGPPT